VSLSRRDLFKSIGCGAAAAGLAAVGTAEASTTTAPADAVSMLYDATVCIGCKACVSACTQVNALIPDTVRSGGLWQMPTDLNASTKNIIQLYKEPDGSRMSFVKRQCMHCIDPACVSGCPFKALTKGDKGIVSWNGAQCIGCRYCEISCPFDVPRFEWTKFNPKIVKCEFCAHRLKDGEEPGCTSVCPTGAVVFGTRDQLLAEGKRRVAAHPGKYYQDRVYGENDLGGTQVLYLAAVPFEKLGLPEVGDESRAHYGSKVHSTVYKGMAIPLALYAVLAVVIKRRWKENEEEAHREEKETGVPHQL
jgi:formate dehydrogenase beta subunit